MSAGTVLAVVLIVVALLALALWHRRNERRDAQLKRGHPKGSDHDPPWQYH
jgi:hypothetical protein